jgi:hypothetical protein
MAVPPWLESEAQQAVQMCPNLALRMSSAPKKEAPKPAASKKSNGGIRLIASSPSDNDSHSDWIADISDMGRQTPRALN